MEFSSRLKELRMAANLSQAELASRLKVSPASIGMYESGQRTPKEEIKELIADYFNVDIAYLMGYEDKTVTMIDPKKVLYTIYMNERPELAELMDIASKLPTDDVNKIIKMIEVMYGKTKED